MKIALTLEEDGLTRLFAAGHPDPWEKKDLYGGAYFIPYGKLGEATEDARNPQLAANLWTASEVVLQSIGA
jgi:hypothetical protein